MLAVLLLFVFDASPAHATEGSDPVCAEQRILLDVVVDGDHELKLEPRRRYLAWLEERGADIAVSADAGETWIDSAPWRWSDEPLLLQTDASGHTTLSIRGMRAGHPQRFALRLRCEESVAAQERAFWAGARELSRLRTELDDDWDAEDGLRALFLGLRALHSGASNDVQRAWTWFQLAALARQRGLLHVAADGYAQAAEKSKRGGRLDWYSSALFRRGQALYAADESGLGSLFLEAAAVSYEEGQHYQAASAKQDYCLILRAEGDTAAAVDCLREQAEAFRQLNEPADQCVALRNLVTALLFLGRYAESREVLAKAAELAEQLNDPREMAGVLVLQSRLDVWEGRFELALQRLQRARDLFADASGPLEVAQIDVRIAHVYLQSGQTQLARSYLEQAIKRFQLGGARGWIGDAQISLARSLRIDGRVEDAIVHAESAVKTLTGHGSVSLRVGALIELANLQALSGNVDAARQHLEHLSASSADVRWGQAVAVALIKHRLATNGAGEDNTRLLGLADDSLARGQLIQYLEILGRLALHGETILPETVLQPAIERAMRLGQQAAGQLGSPYLRNSLLRRLQPIAYRKLFQLRDGQSLDSNQVQALLAPAEALRQLDRNTRPIGVDGDALTELERVLSDELLGSGGDQISESRRRLLLASLGTGGASTELSDVAAPSIDHLARAGSVVYYFAAVDERIGYLRWDGTAWVWRLVDDAEALRQTQQALASLLQAGQADRERIDTLSNSLAGMLDLDRLEPSSVASTFVVADPAIGEVPWSLLPVGREQIPLGAMSTVVELQSLVQRSALPIRQVALMGANPSADSSLESLPRLELELDAVAKAWPASMRHRRSQAGSEQLLEALARPDTLVHLAAHGRGDRGLPEASGLWLQSPTTDTPAFISALRLRDVDANAPLVVLSACESGRSRAGLSLGAGGVAGSLVDAGVSSVVGSRWVVSDRTASQFSEAFHAALASSPASPAEALKHAVALLRAGPATAHPRHWAGWFLLQSGPDA
ncbi:MAG: CHAT domain-containing tetratricopeptide repeat protein [Lysobacteraceae bacterium]